MVTKFLRSTIFLFACTSLFSQSILAKDARAAVDAALAVGLKDVSSVSVYRASNTISCDKVFRHPMPESYAPGGCICYQINAKNSYGGYTGTKTGVATLNDEGAILRSPRELAYNVDDICAAAGMESRDPSKIRKAM